MLRGYHTREFLPRRTGLFLAGSRRLDDGEQLTEQPITVEVEATSPSQALEAASVQLGLDVEELRVTRTHSPFAWPWQKQRVVYTIGRESDAPAPLPMRWSVDFKGGDIRLTVERPENIENQPSARQTLFSDIAEQAKGWPAPIDETALQRAIGGAAGIPVVIGLLPQPADPASPFVVAVAANEMAAYLVLGPSPKRPPSQRRILTAIAEARVVYGVDSGKARQAVTNWEAGAAVCVALGRLPEDGHDALLLEFYGEGEDPWEPVDEEGPPDFFQTRLEEPVSAGHVIAAKLPTTPKTEGSTVRGRVLPADAGVDFNLRMFAGQGVTVSRDGNQLIAEETGHPSMSHGKYTVSAALHIPGDIDFSTGNIDFPGPVIVEGDVLDGFSVSAGADLVVRGAVQAATLKAGGNILLRGGAFGKDRAFISAEGDVRASFLQAAKVTAGGDVLVNREVIRCTVEAGGTVQVGGEFQMAGGKIIGGVIRAGRRIQARQIGSPTGVPTRLTVVADSASAPPVQRIPTIRALAPNSPNPAMGRSETEGMLRRRPSISVKDMVYPPCEIVIGAARLTISEPTQFCKFVPSDNKITIGPY